MAGKRQNQSVATGGSEAADKPASPRSSGSKKHYEGHRARLRDRFLRHGIEGFQEHEIVELLLMFAIPRRDVKPLAKRLLLNFDTLANLLDAPADELLMQEELGKTSVALFKLTRSIGSFYMEQRAREACFLENPEEILKFLRMKLGGSRKETLMAVYLNSQSYLMEYTTYTGTVNKSAAYPREIAEKCLRLGAAEVILAHNHPSGVCIPSDGDIDATRKIQNALNTIGVRLNDHYIVTATSHSSMRKLDYLARD